MKANRIENCGKTAGRIVRRAAVVSAVMLSAVAAMSWAVQPPLTQNNWGNITSPVYNTSEPSAGGVYSSAELFAGPLKFGDSKYFHGVLPNGRIVIPAGISAQIGMNPLGLTVTPDGKFLITSNDDERDGGFVSLKNPTNIGGYSLTVIDSSTMTVVSENHVSGQFFIGLQATGPLNGPYTVWVSGGPSNTVKLYTIDSTGHISAAPTSAITINPITPPDQGFVSNYTPGPALNAVQGNGSKPPVPSGFTRTGSTKITFPAGSILSPHQDFLYVACNGDNSVAVINTSTKTVVKQVAVGYFPYTVALSADGSELYVSNWGITEYKFKFPTYVSQVLTAVGIIPNNLPDGFYVPPTSTTGSNPKTSSVSIINIPGGDGSQATLARSIYLGKTLDALHQVGDTHPSALGLVFRGKQRVLYVAKTNDDSLGLLALSRDEDEGTGNESRSFDLSPINFGFAQSAFKEELSKHKSSRSEIRANVREAEIEKKNSRLVGAYPNGIAVSRNGMRTYVAEAGLNSVAVLDTSNPKNPSLLGRIPTGWYPTGVVLSPDNKTLYVINAKGVGEDINPKTQNVGNNATGIESFTDGNYIFGSAQKIDLTSLVLDNTSVLANNFVVQNSVDTSVVPAGGAASAKIKHVIFILHENKTFDSMLGSESVHFGAFASTTFNKQADGSADLELQFTPISVNTKLLADTFATGVNYYSDSEESDAGHQFCASGTATDYTEKTLLVKGGRGLLVNKNFEPEDYPAGGYIFNNAARNGVSFKDYGAMIRIEGTDTGTSTPTTINDPNSGNGGYPANNTAASPNNVGDVTTQVSGLGQSYFLALPILSILGTNNTNGEARLDRNYPGYNFNISDQRRALEFIKDFDRMVGAGTLPTFIYIYQPNDHTGGTQYTNVAGATGAQQVADGDVALGMVVQHIMKSPIYYDAGTQTGAAIFVTYDDAQSTQDHIHEHRTPLTLVSPFAKPGFLAKRHYVTASIVKTEELLLGLPPNNLGDLFATDLRDMFQPTYNGITAANLAFNTVARYEPSKEGRKIWELVLKLNTSAPDQDSHRLGILGRLSMAADRLHHEAEAKHELGAEHYQDRQEKLYKMAVSVVNAPTPHDSDD